MSNSTTLINRLRSWEREARTNKNGYAQIADHAIQELRRQLAYLAPHTLEQPTAPTPHDGGKE